MWDFPAVEQLMAPISDNKTTKSQGMKTVYWCMHTPVGLHLAWFSKLNQYEHAVAFLSFNLLKFLY